MRPTRIHIAALAAFLVSPFTGCRQEPAAPATAQASFHAEEISYEQVFSQGTGGWETVRPGAQPLEGARSCAPNGDEYWCTIKVTTTADAMRIESPWMLDANHAEGAGNLALLGWVYLDGRYGAPTHGISNLDLRGAVLRLDMRKDALDVKQGHLYFWVQSEMTDGMYVNLAYTAQPLDTLLDASGAWTSVEVPLAADAASWTCLGSSAMRAEDYRCDDVLSVAGNVNFDFGFIILPVDSVPDPAVQPSGAIEFRHIEIARPLRQTP